MRLNSLRIRNYRTVGEIEQTLPLEGGLTVVGPNNSGKSNLLKSIELLFTGLDNTHGYRCSTDLTFGNRSVKTSLLAGFDGDDGPDSADCPIYEQLDQLHSILGTTRAGTAFTLSLQFPASSTPVYQFFPNAKQPGAAALRTQFSRTQRQLVTDLLARFACHYVPSARNIRELHEELLVPFLRTSVANTLQPYTEEMIAALTDIAKAFNSELTAAGLGNLEVSFALPGDSVEKLLHGFEFHVEDPEKTAIFMKGQGIQSTAMLAGLLWMTDQEVAAGKSAIWLLEEPESYLHPELSRSAIKLLERLRTKSLTIVTTHSLSFVPQDPRNVVGTLLDSNRTTIQTFTTYTDATQRLRTALGVKFSDYYNFGRYNLLVEGRSDRELIQWLLTTISEAEHALPLLRQAQLLDFGGVTHLAGFMRATYMIWREERAAVAVFDGDQAGEKARRELQRYFGQHHVPFEANQHYLSVRRGFPIEALFPDGWIVDLHGSHPSWFKSYSVDVSGALESYEIDDPHKNNLQKALMQRAELEDNVEWSSRWLDFARAADAALAYVSDHLST